MERNDQRKRPMDTSSRMRRVRRRDTNLELKVSRALRARGVRFRTHLAGVTGSPDLGLKGKRVAVFIDGCFWHGCPACRDFPVSNREFWEGKFRLNQERRNMVRAALKAEGWTVVEVWGHEVTSDLPRVVSRLARALGRSSVPRMPRSNR
jgi:DNA mismatch endonuclease, patch repair protein